MWTIDAPLSLASAASILARGCLPGRMEVTLFGPAFYSGA